MICLFKALQNKKNLEILNLRDNFIVDGAVNSLCNFLVNADKLRILNLSDCNIKKDSNLHIIEALEVVI